MKDKILERLLEMYPISYDVDIYAELDEMASDLEESAYEEIKEKNPFLGNQQKLHIARKSFEAREFRINNLEADAEGYSELGEISNIDINIGFWKKNIRRLKHRGDASVEDNIKASRRLLLNKWGKSLFTEYNKWELNEIDSRRKRIIKSIGGWLKLLQQFKEVMDALAINSRGLLFDLSPGNLTETDIDQLKEWAEYLKDNESVRELCDILGRIRLAQRKTKERIVSTTLRYENIVRSHTSREEIAGIKIGKDIETLLPQELVLLTDDDASLIFDKRFAEGRLLCFDLTGFDMESIEKAKQTPQLYSEEESLGPIIVCVDTSNSMAGTPENIAKAVAMCMASRANEQKRDCFLINFSTNIETMELSNGISISGLVEFLGRSFHGGTDAAAAIECALNKFQEEDYKKADLLIISDFVMNTLSEELIERIKSMKKNGNRFYSLAICNTPLNEQMDDVFDSQWIYNADTGNVSQLKQIIDDLQNTQTPA